MRRESEKFKPNSVLAYPPEKTLFPMLVWTECCICKDEIKMEKMWRACVGNVYGGRVAPPIFVCKECAPLDSSQNEVAKLVTNTLRPKRPNAPPPQPPSRRKIHPPPKEGTVTMEEAREAVRKVKGKYE